MRIYRGIIEGFRGSWGSGLGHLIVSGQAVPCENGCTVRALEECFGNAIGEGHSVNNGEDSGFIGQDIIYFYDDFGLVMAGFIPTDGFSGELPEIGESLEIEG